MLAIQFQTQVLLSMLVLASAARIDHKHPDENTIKDDIPPQDDELGPLGYIDCGSTVELIDVKVSSCVKTPCKMPIGVPVNVTVEFDADAQPTANLEHEAFWLVQGSTIPFDPMPRTCSGEQCPFRAPDGLAFNATVTVPSDFQALSGQLYWKVHNADGDTLICFLLPIKMCEPKANHEEPEVQPLSV